MVSQDRSLKRFISVYHRSHHLSCWYLPALFQGIAVSVLLYRSSVVLGDYHEELRFEHRLNSLIPKPSFKTIASNVISHDNFTVCKFNLVFEFTLRFTLWRRPFARNVRPQISAVIKTKLSLFRFVFQHLPTHSTFRKQPTQFIHLYSLFGIWHQNFRKTTTIDNVRLIYNSTH